jgi:hypothetical protein
MFPMPRSRGSVGGSDEAGFGKKHAQLGVLDL